MFSIDKQVNPNFWIQTKRNHVSIDRCNTCSFLTILIMILERHYDYPIIEDNKYNVEKICPWMRTINIDNIYISYIEKAIWNELFVCLDLCQNRYSSTLTYSSCSLLMRQACERAFSHDLAFFLSFSRRANARTLTHIHIDTVWWGRANVSIYFILF